MVLLAPCTMKSYTMFDTPSIPGQTYLIICWYISSSEDTPNISLVYLKRPSWLSYYECLHLIVFDEIRGSRLALITQYYQYGPICNNPTSCEVWFPSKRCPLWVPTNVTFLQFAAKSALRWPKPVGKLFLLTWRLALMPCVNNFSWF